MWIGRWSVGGARMTGAARETRSHPGEFLLASTAVAGQHVKNVLGIKAPLRIVSRARTGKRASQLLRRLVVTAH